MLHILIPYFFNFCKLKNLTSSEFEFSFFMIYSIVTLLQCTGDIVKFHLSLAMVVLNPQRCRTLYCSKK